MGRIRTIKPGFFKSETVAKLADFEQLFFIGLWTYVDDDGRGIDNPRLLRAELCPLRDDVSISTVESVMSDLSDLGLIHRYEVDGKRYFAVNGWDEHQKINRPSPSKLPDPSEGTPTEPNGPEYPGQGVFTASSVSDTGNVNETSLQERNKEQGIRNRERNYALQNILREDSLQNPVPELVVADAPPTNVVEIVETPERQRDPIWDTLMTVCRIDTSQLTDTNRSNYGGVVKQLKAIDATSADITRRATAFRVAWPQASLTPRALLNRWAEAEGVATQPRLSGNELELNAWVAEEST